MNKYTPDQYNKILYSLPQEIRDVVMSVDTTKHLWKIGEKHNLHIDKVGDMHDLSMDVMMGVVSTKDFVKELRDVLQISAFEASVLARDIDENIFKPIKETMIHLYAGRAPYKPSSSLVQYYEEDDEHPSLDQATLLKEIEDPEPSQVKKETVTTKVPSFQVSGVSLKDKMQKTTEKAHTEITEYHEELKNDEEKKNTSLEVSGSSLEVKNKEPKIISPRPTDPSYRSSTPFGSATSSKGLAVGSLTPTSPLILSGEEMRNPIKLTSLPADKLNHADNILNQIASLKLNQAFVMPKGAEGIKELKSLENSSFQVSGVGLEVKKQAENKNASFQVSGSGLELKEQKEKKTDSDSSKLEPAPAPKIDPYRERI